MTVHGRGGRLHFGEDAAGLYCNRIGERAHVAHAPHTIEPDHDIERAVIRRRGAAHAGVAALRDDRQPLVGTIADDRRNLGGRAGLHHRNGTTAIAPAPVHHIGLLIRSGIDDVIGADDISQSTKRILEEFGHRIASSPAPR
jgi:hypothetical protein